MLETCAADVDNVVADSVHVETVAAAVHVSADNAVASETGTPMEVNVKEVETNVNKGEENGVVRELLDELISRVEDVLLFEEIELFETSISSGKPSNYNQPDDVAPLLNSISVTSLKSSSSGYSSSPTLDTLPLSLPLPSPAPSPPLPVPPPALPPLLVPSPLPVPPPILPPLPAPTPILPPSTPILPLMSALPSASSVPLPASSSLAPRRRSPSRISTPRPSRTAVGTPAATLAASPGLTAAVKRVVRHHIDAVVTTLLTDKKTYLKAVIQRLKTDDFVSTADNCVKAIFRLKDRKCPAGEMSKFVREMKLLFHGNSLHYFALRVIKEDPFGGGRLRAAAKIQYFAISSYILVDSIFADKRDGDALKFMVRQFRSASVRNVVDCVATHFRDRGAVLNIMRGKECFAGYDVTNPDAKWTNRRIKDFIVDVCRIAELEMPPSTKIVILYVALEPLVDAFLRGETEEDDFFQLAI